MLVSWAEPIIARGSVSATRKFRKKNLRLARSGSCLHPSLHTKLGLVFYSRDKSRGTTEDVYREHLGLLVLTGLSKKVFPEKT